MSAEDVITVTPPKSVNDNATMFQHVIDAIESIVARNAVCNYACEHSKDLWSNTSADLTSTAWKTVDITQSCLNTDTNNMQFNKNTSKKFCDLVVDSGCSTHCISDISLFTHIVDENPTVRVKVANNQYIPVKAVGHVKLRAIGCNGKTRMLELFNAFYTPDIPPNLISTRMLYDDSKITTTLSNSCTLTWPDGDTLHVANNGLHYGLKHAFASVDTYHDFAAANITSDVVHARLGHCGAERAVKAMRTSAGLPNSDGFRKDLSEVCDACKRGGATKFTHRSRLPEHKFTRFGQRIQSDICGPFPRSFSRIITISCHLSTAGADCWTSIFSKTNRLQLY